MKNLKTRALLATALLGLSTLPAWADDVTTNTAASANTPAGSTTVTTGVAVDNTKINQRDRDNDRAPTADHASNQKSDVQLMANIRKAVVDDKSLSTYAHNIKIVAKDGLVNLNGPVKSADESRNIEMKAKQVAGEGNVTNGLSVATH